eukprot:TRINITY_DN1755_c0_g2_i1.p1 TRINITY_DN1755_c0_g2~~TRINITY_DN1755_c0_g2_i1.p1  ORF type:complete len:409 (+),score=222.83 TRINITY_DN1755_c0_g2_i1:103-1329(+)
MVLEAGIICLDNSEWSRNGDYSPNRLEAQKEAITLIANGRMGANRENSNGLIAMGGKYPDVLVTLSPSEGKIITALDKINITGKVNILSSIRIAQLGLKNRQNRNQHQRIIVFVGSPVETEKSELMKCAQILKKNNIALDIISFGEIHENEEILSDFINAVNNNNNSHYIEIPPGYNISDRIISCPFLFSGEEGDSFPQMASGGGDDDFDGLAMVLRMSALEAEEQKKKQLDEAKKASLANMDVDSNNDESPNKNDNEEEEEEYDDDDDEAMQIALAMSLQSNNNSEDNKEEPKEEAMEDDEDDEEEEEEDDDEAMQIALAMSLQSNNNSEDKNEPEEDEEEAAPPPAFSLQKKEPEKKKASDEVQDAIESNPDFLNSVFADLPGVDPNSLVDSLKKENKKDDDKSDN